MSASAKSDSSRRIALWGFGRYGERLFKCVLNHWGDYYTVAAVFDENVESRRRTVEGVVFLNASEVESEYASGSFEAVLVSIARRDLREAVEARLASLGIPTTTLLSLDDLQSFSQFEGVLSRELNHGFDLHVYHSLYGMYAPLYSWSTPLFLFDEEGRITKDNWFMDYFVTDACILNSAYPPKVGAARVKQMSGAYCPVNRSWSKNYWHVTYQTLDQIVLMEQDGFDGKYLMAYSSMAEELLSLMGLDMQRVVWLDDFDPDVFYCFEEVHIVAQERYNRKRSAPLVLEAARRIEERVMQDRGACESYPSRLYVERMASRRLIGDALRVLDEYGFTTIVPEQLSVAEQVRYFKNADIVLTPHGANSTNSLYMRPGAVFIEAFSKRWALPLCAETLHEKGVHYLPIVETPIIEDVEVDVLKDFEVDSVILDGLVRLAAQLVEQGDS